VLQFLKKRKVEEKPNYQLFIGKWKIHRAVLVALDREIPLTQDEFELIEDKLNAGLFVFEPHKFEYSGNKLFPQTGKWRIENGDTITLIADETSYMLRFSDSMLEHQKKLDGLVGYKIYFSRE